ncbi:hypothetical protein KORDIASMS9_02694 [Kordia sp. SMS9]|uniref:hypothetical protein n=1 Tax=Kordia sp. SMS9 TaxID=2282170 RepID=UPI000E103ADE|nr:hypothetical protein [Kordia sp. SMS9]AXG70454.1 hypothetical protein KORDIASMS9_02694 [Kordia sp. SMS9]
METGQGIRVYLPRGKYYKKERGGQWHIATIYDVELMQYYWINDQETECKSN